MIKVTKYKQKQLYQCGECGLHYADKAWAEKCEAWCREYRSCSVEITERAEENKRQTRERPRFPINYRGA
jgi:predicted ATP-dependent serine protease